jgi:hypothetical protein
VNSGVPERPAVSAAPVTSVVLLYQLLVQGRWFSPDSPASSTTKTGRHDKAEILLKVALNTKIQIQIHLQIIGSIKVRR